MTNQDYSIDGLKGLLNDLENISTCLMSIPEEHIDATAIGLIKKNQHSLIEKINSYATMLRELEKE